jgi:hypothetical protein
MQILSISPFRDGSLLRQFRTVTRPFNGIHGNEGDEPVAQADTRKRSANSSALTILNESELAVINNALLR